jgi:lysophospholipase L1-like esterase
MLFDVVRKYNKMDTYLKTPNMNINLRFCLLYLLLMIAYLSQAQRSNPVYSYSDNYLNDLKIEFQKKWPENRTINLVFHGHSVPSGYFETPDVNTLVAYPHVLLKKLKSLYPYAVINVITTSVGGENSVQGLQRLRKDVLTHQPDVLFIDYALNDVGVGLRESYKAWEKMIRTAQKKNIKVILLTPSPDQRIDYMNPENSMKKHSEQIVQLAMEYTTGLVDVYKSFSFLYGDKTQLKKYMSQVNHPNEKGHEMIANEIVKYFKTIENE